MILLVNKEGRQFVNDLAKFFDSLKASDDDDEFDDDVEEEVEQRGGSVSQKQAITAYGRTLRSLARYKYQKRIPAKNSHAKQLNDWLEDRLPSDDRLLTIGRGIATQNGFRRFVRVFDRYVRDVPISYKAFRKNALKSKNGQYSAKPKNNKHVDATELDAVILLMLRNTRELLEQCFVINNLELPTFNMLNIISQQFKNQILVDEATDFSVLQLAAMESLTSLKMRSFFVCGDFNQRITTWGIRSQNQIKWVSGQLHTESINNYLSAK